jgi:hypothetical protein
MFTSLLEGATRFVGIAGFCILVGASSPLVAEETKAKPSAAPAHAGAPAQQHAPGAQPAQHAPGAPGAAGGAAAASHGPTTNTAAGAGAGAGHGITTANPGGNHITTNNPAGAKSAGEPGKAGASTEAKGAAEPGKAGAPAGSAHSGLASASPSFAGHPAPAGSHETHATNGAEVRTRADGSRSDVHDPARGVDIHHGLDGHERVTVEHADHSRIVAEGGGRGYVQHPYMFHGQEFGHRTFYDHGRPYDRFYGRYPYHGRYLDVYAPGRYYPYGFYGYAYSPWRTPVPYAWGWRGAPWYGYYGGYYAPYAVYAGPSLWLTDFLIAGTLAAAYVAIQASASADDYLSPWSATSLALRDASRRVADLLVGPAAAAANPVLTPEVKQQVSDEVKLQIQIEETEAKANSANQNFDPAASNIAHTLSDGHPHVFVAGASLDLVAASGQECAISHGDVLRVATAPAADADTASATILASKGGGKECAGATAVSVAMSDLQDMQNHMREQIDGGLAELKSKQGKDGLPAAPAEGDVVPAAFTVGAPAPDANAANDIAQQTKEAKAAESDATTSVASASAPAAAPAGKAGSPTTIELGQSIDQVTGALGNPGRIIDLGAKKIYVYRDMKIIFQNGAVSDVQ